MSMSAFIVAIGVGIAPVWCQPAGAAFLCIIAYPPPLHKPGWGIVFDKKCSAAAAALHFCIFWKWLRISPEARSLQR